MVNELRKTCPSCGFHMEREFATFARAECERLRRIEEAARIVVKATGKIKSWPAIIQLARALDDTGVKI